ncbi:MAG: type III pantothenate kinase [Candidatus Coatesbacteria bacterium]|nr:MAG: type III pantothenate kinase [Candidatus Coatesbacteria bacterium]
MELLAVDIGNTQVVCGLFDEGNLLFSFRLSTCGERTADEYGLFMASLIESRAGREIGTADSIVCSVVPPLTDKIETALVRYFGRRPTVVGPDYSRLGINVAYDRPEDVGADRVVDALAARETFGAPVIIVDFGTATTLDLVNGNGDYVGGAIMPGLGRAAKTLTESAARLVPVEFEAPASAVGKNTTDSIRSGLIYGTAAAVDGMIEKFREEVGERCPVVATGGLARYVVECSEYIEVTDPDLTLKGLSYAYNKMNR